MNLNLDPASLLVSMLIGSVGFVLFVYGKRQERIPHMVAGGAMLVYPYFVPSVLAMVAIGVGVAALLALVVRRGW